MEDNNLAEFWGRTKEKFSKMSTRLEILEGKN
jgi:hypothetical protein